MKDIIEHQNELVTIPYIECSTVSMVAQYYGVSKTLIRDRYRSNKDELDKRGVMIISSKELEELFPEKAVYRKKSDRCMVTFEFENGQNIPIHVSKNWIFTKEAANYIGTVLTPHTRGRAKHKTNPEEQVIVKKTATQFRTNDEKRLCVNLAKAFASGDTLKLISAALDLDNYRLEQITELKNKVSDSEQSANNIPWTSRTSVSKVVKIISDVINVNKNDLMNKIYYKLIYELGVPLEDRNIMPLIDAVKDNEWPLVYQAISDICGESLLDIDQVFKKSGVNVTGLSLYVNYSE